MELNLGFTYIHEDERARKKGKDGNIRDEETVAENRLLFKGPEKNENGLESPLTAAKLFGPAQAANTTRNVSTTMAIATCRQHPQHGIPFFARPTYPHSSSSTPSHSSASNPPTTLMARLPPSPSSVPTTATFSVLHSPHTHRNVLNHPKQIMRHRDSYEYKSAKHSNLYLTPRLFAHFWSRWTLFDGALSLPIH